MDEENKPVDLDAKPWYASRTIWAGAIGMVATLATAAGFDVIDAQLQAALVSGLTAAGMIVMRLVTSRPVK